MTKPIDLNRAKEIAKRLNTEAASIINSLCDVVEKSPNGPLSNLLSVIHRDGGHRQSQVGTEQAVKEAIELWYEMRQKLDSALAAAGKEKA